MRKFIIIIAVLAFLAAGAFGGRKVYRKWRTEKAVAQAKEAFAKSDYNSGLLWLRNALKADGGNVEAVRMMGDFAEMSDMSIAVAWRKRLVDLEPNVATNRFLLARIAIIHRDFPTAKAALDGVGEADRKTADFQRISGALAISSGEIVEAEKRFRQAAEFDPKDPFPRVQLGMILVQRADPTVAAEGRKMLEALRTDEKVRTDALRQLAFDAFRRTNHARALGLADELMRETNSLFDDRILHLNLLTATRSPLLSARLAEYQAEGVTNGFKVFALSRWMMGSRGPQETMAFLRSVSPHITTNWPVTMSLADTHAGLKDWAGLQEHVSAQHWGEFDYVRQAFLSRALRELGLATAAKAEWSKAIKGAEGKEERLQSLRQVVGGWNWIPELEEILWLLVNKSTSERSASQELSRLLYAQGKTRSLLTLYAQEARLDPGNLGVKNNLASLALLLNAEEHRPHELAQEVYEKQKDNPEFVTTYAFSLHRRDRNAESVGLMRQLRPEQLEKTTIAGYYGLFLTGAGDNATARKFLAIAGKGSLLPEETALFQRALQ